MDCDTRYLWTRNNDHKYLTDVIFKCEMFKKFFAGSPERTTEFGQCARPRPELAAVQMSGHLKQKANSVKWGFVSLQNYLILQQEQRSSDQVLWAPLVMWSSVVEHCPSVIIGYYYTYISCKNIFNMAVFTVNLSHWAFVHVLFQKFSENKMKCLN